MSLNENRLLCSCVRNLISFKLKEHDAPCSSETHFNAALYSLTQLIPNFDLEGFLVGLSKEDKTLAQEMFELAKEEIESYSPLRAS